MTDSREKFCVRACEGIGKRIKVCKDGPVFWAEEVGEW